MVHFWTLNSSLISPQITLFYSSEVKLAFGILTCGFILIDKPRDIS